MNKRINSIFLFTFVFKLKVTMEPKFVITLDGHLRLGYVKMHKDLLLPGDECIGGGFWSVDYTSMKLMLDGKSYDYGKPKWLYLDSLRVPEDYKGMRIEYKGDNFMEDFEVSKELQISYY